MTVKSLGEEYRTTVVCVDSYDERKFCGRFYNPYLSEGKRFGSMTHFLLEMEETLNNMEYPKSFTAIRSFAQPPDPAAVSPGTGSEFFSGDKATFALRILFRQNASWQGSVTWLEGKKEQSFRSVLELILLMDSALSIQQAG